MPFTAEEQALIDTCRESYGSYYLSVNDGYKYVPYQQEIIVPALEELESGENDRLMLLMAPGHSKSRLCTAGFLPWAIGRRPDREVLIISYGDDPASEFGQWVRDYLNSDFHHLVFPWCKLKGPAQATTYFQTTQGGKIYAASFNGALARIRADLILIDDPLKNGEDAASEQIMDARMRIIWSVVVDRLKPGGKILLCTNRWAPRDVVGRILEREPKRWKVVTLLAEPPPNHPQAKYLAPGKKYLWEEHYGTERYESKKQDQWAWETTYQQRPEMALPQRFEKEWIQYYTDRINPGQFHCGMVVDPALAKHKLADRSSIMVFAGGPNEKIFLVDWILDRLDPNERTRAVIKLADRWEVDWILWEEVGMSSDSFYLNEEIDRYGLNCPVIPIGRKGPKHNWSKHQRIMQLIPAFKEGRIILPNELWFKQRDGIRVDLIDYFINREYLPYAGANSIPHDEGLDTMSRIFDEEFQLQFDEGTPQSEEDEDKREDGAGQFEHLAGGRGSWFSRL